MASSPREVDMTAMHDSPRPPIQIVRLVSVIAVLLFFVAIGMYWAAGTSIGPDFLYLFGGLFGLGLLAAPWLSRRSLPHGWTAVSGTSLGFGILGLHSLYPGLVSTADLSVGASLVGAWALGVVFPQAVRSKSPDRGADDSGR